MLTDDETRIVIIVCSILGGLTLFLTPIIIILCVKHKRMVAARKKNNLQLNEEEFKKHMDYANNGFGEREEKEKGERERGNKQSIYMNFNDEDMIEGMPRKYQSEEQGIADGY